VPTLPKSVVPPETKWVTLGVDLGKYLARWVAVAWPRAGAAGHILDYGRLEVPSQDLGVERAILTTLRRLRDEVVLPGWSAPGGTQPLQPSPVFVDAGHGLGEQSRIDAAAQVAFLGGGSESRIGPSSRIPTPKRPTPA
jgi:hypothetical protein